MKIKRVPDKSNKLSNLNIPRGQVRLMIDDSVEVTLTNVPGQTMYDSASQKNVDAYQFSMDSSKSHSFSKQGKRPVGGVILVPYVLAGARVFDQALAYWRVQQHFNTYDPVRSWQRTYQVSQPQAEKVREVIVAVHAYLLQKKVFDPTDQEKMQLRRTFNSAELEYVRYRETFVRYQAQYMGAIDACIAAGFDPRK